MISRRNFLIGTGAILASLGCGTRELRMKGVDLWGLPEKQDIDLLIEPYQSLGLKLTPDIKSGNITVVQGIFPDILFGEYYPGRIRWNSWLISEDGKEYYAQALFAGIDYTGHFLWLIVIDGKPPVDAKALILSTFVDFIYDLGGNEYAIERSKLINDKKYRTEIAKKYGSKVGDMKQVSAAKVAEAIRQWNKYQTPDGVLVSPLGEEEVKLIAGINPQYSFSEKLIGSGRFSISMDPITTAVGVGIDILRAGSVPSTGWDYMSQLPTRRNMAFIIKYVAEMKQRLINQINQANAKKFTDVKNTGGKR